MGWTKISVRLLAHLAAAEQRRRDAERDERPPGAVPRQRLDQLVVGGRLVAGVEVHRDRAIIAILPVDRVRVCVDIKNSIHVVIDIDFTSLLDGGLRRAPPKGPSRQ